MSSMDSVTGDFPLWHTTLCDCLEDPHSCVDIVCCWSCQVARQWDAALNSRWDSCNVVVCAASCIFWPFAYVAPVCIRHRIVARYQIDEPLICTVAVPLLCWYLSMCQTYRELNERELWPGGTVCVPRPAHMSGAPPAEYSVAMGDRRSGYGSL